MNSPLLNQATLYLSHHESTLQTAWLITTTFAATVMLTASLLALISPTALSTNFGLPLHPPSASKSTPAQESQTLYRHGRGWMVAFSGREFAIALAVLVLSYQREYRGLSVLVQASQVCGFADAYAAWRFGVPGSWKMHFFPTVAMSWAGPLGLWLFW